MPILHKPALTIIFVLSLLGCSTPYQQKDFFGGFSETQLDTNVWRIRFNGNAFTSQDKVRDLSLLRACEIALRTGYSYVAVISDKDQVKKSEAQIGSTTYVGTSTCTGGACSAIVNSYPPSKIPFTKYGSEQLVAFYRDRPENVFVVDASMSYRSLSSRYGVPIRSFRTAPKASYSEEIARQADQQRSVNVIESRNQTVELTADDIYYDAKDNALWPLAEKISALTLSVDNNNISIGRNGGYYLLYGQVENNISKQKITEIFSQHPYVVRIYNELELVSPISRNQKRQDQKTKRILMRDSKLKSAKTGDTAKVFVSDGVVYLMGKLDRVMGEELIDFVARYPDDNIKRIVSVIEWID